MGLAEQLANLKERGILAAHDAPIEEIQQHMLIAKEHLADAKRKDNSLVTRFSVAYAAGHALLVAAIKMNGFRTTSEKGHRAILYQILDVLLPGAAGAQEPLLRANNTRNKAEYDGDAVDVTQGQVDDVIDAVKNVSEEVEHLFRGFKSRKNIVVKLRPTKDQSHK